MSALDYYYGDESNQFSFCRIPRQIITGPEFKKLSNDAKLLYALMLERMGLSAKNDWRDEQERVKQGQSKPTKIFVKNFFRQAATPG